MREARNAARLAHAGIPPENDIPSSLDSSGASATATITNGTITAVTMTSTSSGYSLKNPPRVNVYPFGCGALLVPVIESDGSISSLYIVNGGRNLAYAEIIIDPPPTVLPPN
jgi:hypothetical protein